MGEWFGQGRLRSRGTETEEAILTRTANAKAELESTEIEGFWDAVLVNDQLDVAQTEMLELVVPTLPPRIPTHPEDWSISAGESCSSRFMPDTNARRPRAYRYFEISSPGPLALAGIEFYGKFLRGALGL